MNKLPGMKPRTVKQVLDPLTRAFEGLVAVAKYQDNLSKQEEAKAKAAQKRAGDAAAEYRAALEAQEYILAITGRKKKATTNGS